jgi:hypothetical protein
VILAYLESGKLERTAGDKWYRNCGNAGSSFWRADNVKDTSFWVVFKVQKLYYLYWRCWAIRRPINKKYRWKQRLRRNSLKTRRLTVQVSDMLGILFRSFQNILNGNLNVCSVAAKFMPCLMSEELTLMHMLLNLWLEAKWRVIPLPLHSPPCDISFPKTQNGIKWRDI